MADGMGNGVKKQRKTLKIRSPPRSLSIENYSDSNYENYEQRVETISKEREIFPDDFCVGNEKDFARSSRTTDVSTFHPCPFSRNSFSPIFFVFLLRFFYFPFSLSLSFLVPFSRI